ncbi:hypothetical protein [Alysiella crassa]|nr:hypothetical protein [Alysiella crassa]
MSCTERLPESCINGSFRQPELFFYSFNQSIISFRLPDNTQQKP